MPEPSLLDRVNQDLVLVYDVITYLNKLAPNVQDTKDLITRLHDVQNLLLGVKANLTGG